MTTDQAETILGTLTKKHPKFKMLGFQCQPGGELFVTFEPVTVMPGTVNLWFEDAGGNAVRIGTEGTGDNAVMYAVVRL